MQKSALTKKKRAQSHRVLADLLAGASGKKDPEELAKELLLRYGSLAPIMESDIEDLRAIPGVTPSVAHMLNILPQLTRYLATEEFGESPKLNTFERARVYFSARYIGRYYEQCYLASLDRTGRLLSCDLTQQGTVDKTPFYVRLLLEAAIRNGAYAVVLSHNHPSGTMTISPADAAGTRAAIDAFNKIGVIVLDHIVVCDDMAISIRGASDNFRALFDGQSDTCSLLRHWYRAE